MLLIRFLCFCFSSEILENNLKSPVAYKEKNQNINPNL